MSPSTIACPGCSRPMLAQTLGARYRDPLVLDLCGHCRVLWLDQMESTSLTPGALIELFRTLNEAREIAHPLPAHPACPRCDRPLRLTQDLHRGGRLVYHRCPTGHGRLITFHQFLREKGFIRELGRAEIDGLRVRVAQIGCSNCGAPIDLARDVACRYCRSPLAVLDADAVSKTLANLSQQETARRAPPDINRIVDVLLAQEEARRRQSPGSALTIRLPPVAGVAVVAAAVDLISAGLSALFDREAERR